MRVYLSETLAPVRQLLVKDAGSVGIRPMLSNGPIANPRVRLSCLYIWFERLVLLAIVYRNCA